MKAVCLIGHKWNGCTCARCGAVRDQEHEWVVHNCRIHCRKCDLPGDFQHNWQGCRCRDCGAVSDDLHQWERCRCKVCGLVHHQWLAGVCTACGEKCPHPESMFTVQLQESEHTAHGARVKICKLCGALLK